MFWGPHSPWSLCHFFLGVNRSYLGITSAANQLPYKTLVQLHGPYCKPALSNNCNGLVMEGVWSREKVRNMEEGENEDMTRGCQMATAEGSSWMDRDRRNDEIHGDG